MPLVHVAGSSIPSLSLPAGVAAIRELAPFKCAAVIVKGAYTQMGFAHYILRHNAEQAGLADAVRQVREIYHYQEAPDSDANITELQLEIGDE